MFRRIRRSERRTCEPDEVRAARESAERAEHQRIRAAVAEVNARRVGGILRDALEANHFGQAIDAAMARRRST